MAKKSLDKKATQAAIIKTAQTSNAIHIDVEAFKRKITSVKDILECCKFEIGRASCRERV